MRACERARAQVLFGEAAHRIAEGLLLWSQLEIHWKSDYE
jgi:hypothetical protein